MKNIVVAILVLALIMIGAFTFSPTQKKEEFIRIHIRANSNTTVDQNVKYQIKDQIVLFLAPKLAYAENREDVVTIIENNLLNMKNVAQDVLQINMFDYGCNVKFVKEQFPTRAYDGVVLNSGFYDSIIVELGTAKGDNWWCVVYPPLCFVDANTTNVVYRSRLANLIKKII